MAEGSRKNQDVSSEVGIPSGLNRIRTRQVSSKDHLSSKPDELTASWGHGASRPPLKQKQKQDPVAQRQGETIERKGKKIARWFTSYISKYSGQSLNNVHANTEDGDSKITTPDERECRTTKQSSANSVYGSNVLKGLKSFSHELGPRGGIQPAYPRPHSYSDLKELLSSFSSRFDAAKEIVNTELAGFAEDVVDIIDKIDSPFPEEKRMAEDLLLLAQNCVEMTSSQFRAKCETIVQDLTEKRQQCQTGLVKWLFTWMLFILTRCTRLLIFQKENEPMDEKSLNKFKKCLDSIPAVEMSWVPTPGVSDSSSGLSLYQRFDAQQKLQGIIMPSSLPEASWCSSIQPADQSDLTSKKDSFVLEKKFPSQKSQFGFLSEGKQFHLGDGSYEGKSLNDSGHDSLIKQQHSLDGSFNEQEQTLDGSDSVICRICEEAVPISHLESHSYICAYADKCELSCVDVDERLLKLEEILEQIIESRNLSSYPPVGSPEPRIQTTNSGIASEGYSPKVNEWRNKGVEGMFEEIHEMDTACIDEFYPNPINLKNYLGIKLYNCGAPSSTGSMTSVSSTNTPRTSHFDSFWLEHNNPSEQEDVHEMIDLADIARCVAGTDISKEGSYEYLLACMQDLQDVLKRSKLKALVVDTFGGRIEKLLREKYILACEAIDVKSPKSYSKCNESTRLLLDSASQSGMTLSPSQMLHKDRTSIDDFEIIKPISRGAFGKVFLARKRTTGDLFAIKVLKKLDMIRKNDIERILAERNILITVRNPFVVRFFYSFTCRDNLYLVMEYLNGGDLYSLLRKVGCLEEDVARIYIAELVLALEYLHSLGIVHRDLKPDNILIAHDGHIKLTDFGLSKIGLINNTINLSGPETELTRASNVHNLHAQQTEDTSWHSAVGTPDYLAPEILLGTEHGYAADWWSVGIILFELITGIPPFSAERSEVIFDNILNKKIPWPNIPGDMSYEAQDLINRFLIHDPNQRLGASGSAEVKSDPFFRGVNWDSLALQKAAFVPQPDSIDDTSYFVSRFSRISSGMPDEEHCSKSCTDSCHSCSNSGDEIDECGDLAEFDSSSLNLSLINFSFKNLSQLASINHDVLLQTGKDPAKGSPSKNMGT